MISYELANELKDAGWPQSGSGGWVGPADKIVLRSGDRVYAPTLSELIEACGSKNFILGRTSHYTEISWDAQIYDATTRTIGKGQSAEEAVARLWLALYGNIGASA